VKKRSKERIEEIATMKRNWRKQRKSQGLCMRCPNKTEINRVHCAKCAKECREYAMMNKI
jgi:hypothetical protein